jgi:hypothetical protein
MPIRFTLKSFLLSAAVVLPASLAAADDSFERQDSNQDGVLSGREATDLKLLDQDSDGETSEAGFNDAARAQKVQVIRKEYNDEAALQNAGQKRGRHFVG